MNPNAIPVGTILSFAGTTIPADYVLCDGRPLSRTQYAALFAVSGTLFGQGDGVNTFNVPNLSGQFLRGANSAAGRAVGSAEDWATGMPRNPFVNDPVGDHAHLDPTWNGQDGPYELAVGPARGPGGHDYGPQAAPTTPGGAHNHAIRGGDRETRPMNVAVNFIIRAR